MTNHTTAPIAMVSTAKTINSEIIQPGIYPGIAMKARIIAKLTSIIPPRKIQCAVSPAAIISQGSSETPRPSVSSFSASHPFRIEFSSSLSP
jgi:hypothetical protein